MGKKDQNWTPLSEENLTEIRKLFETIFPDSEYKDLAKRIADYWITMLTGAWENKKDALKEKDLGFRPSDPLSKIRQNTVVIAYADSVKKSGEKSLATLDNFLKKHFPAIRGMHMLPACEVAEDRFNDGFFSQIVRDRIHPPFGSNQVFSDMMETYYSMADFVLNHVDINNPSFQAFLNGDDGKKDCFFIYTEEEYRDRLARGDFKTIFRPRPFPLFTIFRRQPTDVTISHMSVDERLDTIQAKFAESEKKELPVAVVRLFTIFNKIKNDQMLLEDDYQHILSFIEHLKTNTGIDPGTIFAVSETQETNHTPFIFHDTIQSIGDLLVTMGYDEGEAGEYADIYRRYDHRLFGEEIRALTTFSHVQVDLNTSTYNGLKMLADDFSWYLSLDLNMLRLDAANFAFKKWGTSCFGLPEVSGLMKILYLSIDSVSPRIVANLEVNDQLGSILSQMANKDAPPPMMYDFHLACILPVVFNAKNARILPRIFEKIATYDIPKESIRFSLAESHDGKSVRGSLDILTPSERQMLADTVEKNNGRVKYKSVPGGREPYELCVSTRDAMIRLECNELEAKRYLAFYTLAFALMGRHVKSIYFNDLLGLPNDYDRFNESGELRDLKRTKSDCEQLEALLNDTNSIHHHIATGINHLISIVDADPALHFRGNEADALLTQDSHPSVAVIFNHYRNHYTWTIVNLGQDREDVVVDFNQFTLPETTALFENINKETLSPDPHGFLTLTLQAYQRLWLSLEPIQVEIS